MRRWWISLGVEWESLGWVFSVCCFVGGLGGLFGCVVGLWLVCVFCGWGGWRVAWFGGRVVGWVGGSVGRWVGGSVGRRAGGWVGGWVGGREGGRVEGRAGGREREWARS